MYSWGVFYQPFHWGKTILGRRTGNNSSFDTWQKRIRNESCGLFLETLASIVGSVFLSCGGINVKFEVIKWRHLVCIICGSSWHCHTPSECLILCLLWKGLITHVLCPYHMSTLYDKTVRLFLSKNLTDILIMKTDEDQQTKKLMNEH